MGKAEGGPRAQSTTSKIKAEDVAHCPPLSLEAGLHTQDTWGITLNCRTLDYEVRVVEGNNPGKAS